MTEISIEKLASLCEESPVYTHLETLCICFPGRISGSKILDSALDFLEELGSKTMGLKMSIVPAPNCPQWVRGPADEEKFHFEINVPNGVSSSSSSSSSNSNTNSSIHHNQMQHNIIQ